MSSIARTPGRTGSSVRSLSAWSSRRRYRSRARLPSCASRSCSCSPCQDAHRREAAVDPGTCSSRRNGVGRSSPIARRARSASACSAITVDVASSPAFSQGGGRRTLHFEEGAIDEIPSEPFVPDGYCEMRILRISEYEQLNAAARWAVALLALVATLPEELRSLSSQLDGRPNDAAHVAAALRWGQGGRCVASRLRT